MLFPKLFRPTRPERLALQLERIFPAFARAEIGYFSGGIDKHRARARPKFRSTKGAAGHGLFPLPPALSAA